MKSSGISHQRWSSSIQWVWLSWTLISLAALFSRSSLITSARGRQVWLLPRVKGNGRFSYFDTINLFSPVNLFLCSALSWGSSQWPLLMSTKPPTESVQNYFISLSYFFQMWFLFYTFLHLFLWLVTCSFGKYEVFLSVRLHLILRFSATVATKPEIVCLGQIKVTFIKANQSHQWYSDTSCSFSWVYKFSSFSDPWRSRSRSSSSRRRSLLVHLASHLILPHQPL